MYGHTRNLGIWSTNSFCRWVSDRMLSTYTFLKPFAVKFPDKCEWQNRFNSDNKEGMGWFIDGSKTNKGTGAGVYRWGSKRSTATPWYYRLKCIPSRLA